MPDHQAPVRYIQRQYEAADYLAIMLRDRHSKKTIHEFRAVEQICAENYQRHLRAANASGKDVYLSVNSFAPGVKSRVRSNVHTIRHVFLDIDEDGKAIVDRILAARETPRPSAILQSSEGKFQVLWRVDGFQKDEAELLNRNMAGHFGADRSVWDSTRVLRLPGFRNTKYEPAFYCKEVLENPADRLYRPADFPPYCVSQSVARFGDAKLRRTVPGGSQSERDFAFAMRHLEKGDLAPEIIERKIAEFRQARGDKPHAETYARRTVMNARVRLVAQPISLAETAANPPARDGPEVSR